MSPQAVTPLPHAGLSIPNYELLRPIGRGAYGEVWLARNLTGSWVALKIVHRSAFDHDRPFEREFEGIKRFEPISRSDPSQVAILHVGLGEGFFYYVMELADDSNAECGTRNAESNLSAASSIPQSALRTPNSYAPLTLKRLLNDRGALPAQECLAIALSLTRALAHLHGHGLVHRDVKPSNVIFVNGQAKLADIGLVTSVDATRSFVGTEGYLPAEGAGTPQADLFALGKVLYEMSTGCDRKEFPALPPDIATRPDRDALAELNVIVVRACQLDPRQRYASAAAMLNDLELLQRGQSLKRKRAWEHYLATGKRVGFVSAMIVVLTLAGWWMLNDYKAGLHRTQASQTKELPPVAGTKNLEAWKLYERGRVQFRRLSTEGLKLARQRATEAVKLDPNFLQAHQLLFTVYVHGGALTAGETEAGLRATVKNLRELAPDSAEAQYANAWVKFSLDIEFAEAEQGFRRAVEINPDNSFAHGFYGYYLTQMGRLAEARQHLRQFDDLDPGFPVAEQLLGSADYAERKYDQALAHFEKALELAPDYLVGHRRAEQANEGKGDYLKAIDHRRQIALVMGQAAESVNELEALQRAFNASGATGYWRTKLEQAQSDAENQPYNMALILAQLGKKEEALDWLEKAYAKHDLMDQVMFDHYWIGLRDEPRFQALLKKVGYVK